MSEVGGDELAQAFARRVGAAWTMQRGSVLRHAESARRVGTREVLDPEHLSDPCLSTGHELRSRLATVGRPIRYISWGRQLSKDFASKLQQTVAGMRSSADAVFNDPGAPVPVKHVKRGAAAASQGLGRARRAATQEEAWSECRSAIEEIVDVLIVQSRLIEALTEKVEALERSDRGRDRS